MVSGFGGGEDRWEAANSGHQWASCPAPMRSCAIGLTSYASDDGFGPNWPGGSPLRQCPNFGTEIDFALDNSTNIGDDNQYPYSYPSDAGADTPTGDSIDALVSNIQSSPPPNDGPTIIVLATDGAPDSCEYPESQRWDRTSAGPTGEAVSASRGLTMTRASTSSSSGSALSDEHYPGPPCRRSRTRAWLPADGSSGTRRSGWATIRRASRTRSVRSSARASRATSRWTSASTTRTRPATIEERCPAERRAPEHAQKRRLASEARGRRRDRARRERLRHVQERRRDVQRGVPVRRDRRRVITTAPR